MRWIRDGRAAMAVVAAAFACLVLFAGCGGGGDDNVTTSASVTVPGVTSPGEFTPGTRSTPTTPRAPESTTTTPAAPGTGPPGAGPNIEALASFRDCLTRHGVDPAQFRPGFRGQGQRDPAEVQKQIEAGIACIPELPPQLRKAAERLKRRYEQRQRGG